MCCIEEASDTRVDVQSTSLRLSRFSWSCCCRLPSLGCRRVRITLPVADFPRNTSSREALRFPADAVDGHSGACLLLVTQNLSAFASHEAAALRCSQDLRAGIVHARSDWCYLRPVVCFFLLNVSSVCVSIFAEGVVGVRRVPHRQTCACIRMGDRYG